MDKTTHAINIVRSWLTACDVSHEVSNNRLNINGREITLPPKAVKALLSTKANESLNAFHKLTKEAGLGMPQPVDRGVAPSKKVYDDKTLPRIRHTEFRTAPNNEEALKTWMPVINRLSRSFFSKNKQLCKTLGYDVDDIKTYVMCWTTTFVHRYAIHSDGDDNVKLLTTYIVQRFGELYRSLLIEKRSSIVNQLPYYELMADEEPDVEWKEEHDKIKVKSPAARKKRVVDLLEEEFQKLDHDSMVTALEVAQKHPCPDTRKAAMKRLARHKESCEKCLVSNLENK